MSKVCNPKLAKATDPNYICNPLTGKWVLKTGAIGKKIVSMVQGAQPTPKGPKPKAKFKSIVPSKPKAKIKAVVPPQTKIVVPADPTCSLLTDEFITITFGEVAETHVGMRKEGNIVPVGEGLSPEMLGNIEQWFNTKGCETELIDLTTLLTPDEQALGGMDIVMEARKTAKITVGNPYVLIVRNGVDALSAGGAKDKLYDELRGLDWDKQALSRGRIVNKQLRHNLNFGKEEVKQDLAAGIGSVMKFDDVPNLQALHTGVMSMLQEHDSDFVELRGEGNRYYNKTKCCINWHGDAERRIVIAARFGATLPIRYLWHYKSKPVGKQFIAMLNHGDIYFMSEKAVGTDWARKNYLTLRHAAGCDSAMRK